MPWGTPTFWELVSQWNIVLTALLKQQWLRAGGQWFHSNRRSDPWSSDENMTFPERGGHICGVCWNSFTSKMWSSKGSTQSSSILWWERRRNSGKCVSTVVALPKWFPNTFAKVMGNFCDNSPGPSCLWLCISQNIIKPGDSLFGLRLMPKEHKHDITNSDLLINVLFQWT